jgi:hypothetical protein
LTIDLQKDRLCFFYLSPCHCHYVQLNDCEFLKTVGKLVCLYLVLGGEEKEMNIPTISASLDPECFSPLGLTIICNKTNCNNSVGKSVVKNSLTEDSARQVTEEPKTKVSVAGPVRENNTAQTRSGAQAH